MITDNDRKQLHILLDKMINEKQNKGIYQYVDNYFSNPPKIIEYELQLRTNNNTEQTH